MKGCFITFEGGEGSGKSTQIKMLADALVKMGKGVVTTREPGGCPSAEEIRSLLVTGAADRWEKTSETLLFYASRNEHLVRKIIPALESGQIVLCDRFIDSTMAYQGYGYGNDEDQQNLIKSLNNFVVRDVQPDITFLLDIDVNEGLKRSRRADNTEQRFEDKNVLFHQQLRNAYLEMAKQDPERIVVIDANRPKEVVHQQIFQELMNRQILNKNIMTPCLKKNAVRL